MPLFKRPQNKTGDERQIENFISLHLMAHVLSPMISKMAGIGSLRFIGKLYVCSYDS